ncbi:MAG: hypothetical protein HYZ42_09840, partial [Bacteroidetes bacterium]|nr:hypothetical protein [Bacteroidota bacterium]
IDVMNFVDQYHKVYFSEPTDYSFKAFDQMMSIGQGWLANPSDWKQHPEQWSNGDGLSNSINYTRDENSENIINQNIKILKFENYQLKWVW